MVVGQRNPLFKIRSSDGQIFVIQDWLIQKSKSFSVVYPFMKDSAQPLQTTVSSFILEKIIEWCHHHRHDDADQDYRLIPVWDAQFLNDNNGIVFLLIEAAYRLEIRGLLDIACRAVSITLGRSMNEVKVMLRVGEPEDVFNVDDELREDDEEDADMIPAIPAA
ncbi:CRE-SKR-21 protein [Caenorhabditis remanei]|uniref:CRE-SKR-21 protein n=1 Tax=Caenorhabditis remanei TaxID=31234 RepID=E3MJM9_CAERE|nr:CRE-SKR-21 protein [Caenorhabditis remanei]